MPDPMLLQPALLALAATTTLAVLTWIVSLVRHDASLVDRMWPVFIASASVTYAAWMPTQMPLTTRMLVVLSIVVVWAVRLCTYITWRNWGHGEDRRYQAIRQRNEPGFAWKSLVYVFMLQAVLAWIVSAPLLAAGSSGAHASASLSLLDVLGAALAVFGVAFEAVGDAQMARFKSQPANRGRVMDEGLWRYTRHPNYFGECCVWWGVFLMALAAGGVWSVISPLLMTVLLLNVSGVSLLEKDIEERRPAYRDYVRRTNAFIPGPPRRTP